MSNREQIVRLMQQDIDYTEGAYCAAICDFDSEKAERLRIQLNLLRACASNYESIRRIDIWAK